MKQRDDISEKLKEIRCTLEDQVKNIQQELKSEQEKSTQLQASSDTEIKKLKSEISNLQTSMKSDSEASQNQINQLQNQLEGERLKCAEMLVTLERERNEREAAALKSANISQQAELAGQSLEILETKMVDLRTRIEELESTIVKKDEEIVHLQQQKEEIAVQVLELQREKEHHIAASNQEHELRESVSELESQLLEKNKNIKQLQQRLGDMKKTLQRELNLQSGGFSMEFNSNGTTSSGSASEDTSAAVLAPSSSHQVSQRRLQLQAGATSTSDHLSDVNFQYLKHVLIKFLTSREYEAKHLTRAVATLLHFSPDEEKLLRETLEWKMSWFGSRPSLGFGQTAKTIPPS